MVGVSGSVFAGAPPLSHHKQGTRDRTTLHLTLPQGEL